MKESVERSTDPAALRRYQARIEAPGYLSAGVEVALAPDSDLDANCRRVKPTELVVRLTPDPASRNPGGTVYLELVEAIADKVTWIPGSVDPEAGVIIYDDPCGGRSEHRWDPMPKRIYPGDAILPMGLAVSATAIRNGSLVASTTIKLFAGMRIREAEPVTSVEVVSREGVTATATARFSMMAPLELAGWAVGTEAFVLVEGGGRTAIYHYRAVQ
jgi:hypothetical protein